MKVSSLLSMSGHLPSAWVAQPARAQGPILSTVKIKTFNFSQVYTQQTERELKTHLHTNDHSSIIRNGQKVKSTQVFTNRH